MVCVDNSVSSIKFASQVDAIQLYCHAKLKSNPKTAVGVVAMAIHCLQQFGRALDTTSDLDEIMDCVKAIARGGELDFVGGITFAELYLTHYHPHIDQNRMLIFTGGSIDMDFDLAKACGKNLKKRGIAVDLVNLSPELQHKLTRRALNVLVASVNNNKNSHIKHVVAGSAIRDVLSSTPAIITSEEIAAAAADLKAPRLPRKEKVIEKMDMKVFFEELKKGSLPVQLKNMDWCSEGHSVYKKTKGDGVWHAKFEISTQSGRKFTRGFKTKATKRNYLRNSPRRTFEV
ncbi:26S proteasome non-ATPase regulatory subunit 4 [Tanacetum coccineum]